MAEPLKWALRILALVLFAIAMGFLAHALLFALLLIKTLP